MKTFLLVDGHALIHRAFFALPPFKTYQGMPTNAIYGFFTMLHRAILDFKPDYIAVCFDTPKPTFRQKLYKEYQVQRPPTEHDLKVQIPILKELLEKAGIYQAEKPGYEADDVIGTLTIIAKKENVKTLILTGDRDIMQLVDGNVYVVTPQIGFSQTKIYDRKEVEKKFGITPEQVADFKALVGDPSDNYPGIRGIGPKTALKLLNQFKTIENMLINIQKIEEEKLRKLIETNKKNLVLSKKLSYIVTDIKLGFKLDDAEFKGFGKDLEKELLKFEMRSLARRFFSAENLKKENKPVEIKKNESQTELF